MHDLSRKVTEGVISSIIDIGIVFNRVINSSNLEVVADLTAHGCGIGILPTRVAKRHKQFFKEEKF